MTQVRRSRVHPARRPAVRPRRTRVFVSFDFGNDLALYHFIIGQARLPDSPFTVADHSLKEEAPQAQWERRARAAIARSDVFIVMLGPSTVTARGVRKEIAIANALGIRRFRIIGYRSGSRSWAVPGAGRTYLWNWENLNRLLA